MKESELREETYRILKTLAEERSFRSVKNRLPGVTERKIWNAISDAASILGALPRIEKHRSLKVYVDGAAVPNPGPSGIGVVIYNDRKKIKEIKKDTGFSSNNVAEYKALIQGLKESKKLFAQNVSIFTDSQLLVNQMRGNFRINNEDLRRLSQQARNLESKFEKVNYCLIGREKNRLADQLANSAIRKSA